MTRRWDGILEEVCRFLSHRIPVERGCPPLPLFSAGPGSFPSIHRPSRIPGWLSWLLRAGDRLGSRVAGDWPATFWWVLQGGGVARRFSLQRRCSTDALAPTLDGPELQVVVQAARQLQLELWGTGSWACLLLAWSLWSVFWHHFHSHPPSPSPSPGLPGSQAPRAGSSTRLLARAAH